MKRLLQTALLAAALPAVTTVPIASLQFQLGAPLLLNASTNNAWLPVSYALPISVGLTAGYGVDWNPMHRSLALFLLNYDDDPVNNLFEPSLSSRNNQPTFSGQTLNQNLSLKHYLNFGRLRIGLGGDLSVALNRTSAGSTFDKGLYNHNDLGVSGEIRLKDLPFGALLKNAVANGKFTVRQSWYPNYTDANSAGESLLNSLSAGASNSTKSNRQDNIHFIAGGDINNVFFPGLAASASYEYELNPYNQKWLIDNTGNQTDFGETVTRSTFNAQVDAYLIPPSTGRALFRLSGRVFLEARGGNHLEQSTASSNQVAGLPSSILAKALYLGDGSVGLFFSNYNNENVLSVGGDLGWYPTPDTEWVAGYSYTRRDSLGKYARFTDGTYSSNLIATGFHNLTLGWKFKGAGGYRTFNPFVGYQVKNSTDLADPASVSQLFFVGFRTSYEF